MQRYQNVIQSQTGQAISGATVTVRVAHATPGSGALATIYSDDGSTVIGSSAVTTDARGLFGFFAADGKYDLVVTGTGITQLILGDVEIADVVEQNSADSVWLAKELDVTTLRFPATAPDITLERISANLLGFGAGDSVAVDTILLDSASRDVSLERPAANVLGLGAGDALALDQLQLDRNNRDVVLSRASANKLQLASGDSFQLDEISAVGTINLIPFVDGVKYTTIAGADAGLSGADGAIVVPAPNGGSTAYGDTSTPATFTQTTLPIDFRRTAFITNSAQKARLHVLSRADTGSNNMITAGFELDATAGSFSGGFGENVALYAGAIRRATSTRSVWASNFLVNCKNLSTTAGCYGLEIDVDNESGVDATVTDLVDGLVVLNGRNKKSRNAILVGKGASSSNWLYGMSLTSTDIGINLGTGVATGLHFESNVTTGIYFNGLASNNIKFRPAADNTSAQIYGANAADSLVTWQVKNDGAGEFKTVAATAGGMSATQYTSTIATGTAPLVVASTTNVVNLNASSLSGATFAAPGAIGGVTPAAGTFTTLVGNTSVSSALYGSATNCSSSAAPAVCAAAAAGSVVIAAAGTTVTVNTTAVTANSQILITEDSSLGTKLGVTCNTVIGRNASVTARTAATSFVISVDVAPVTNPMCLSYWIIN